MKRNSRLLALGLCIILALAANVFATDEITITGTIYGAAWDDNDNVIEAVISGEGGEYIIVDNAVGHQLLNMAGTDVEVTGVIGEDAEGNQTITVVNYKVIAE
jgi:hypothetical protein